MGKEKEELMKIVSGNKNQENTSVKAAGVLLKEKLNHVVPGFGYNDMEGELVDIEGKKIGYHFFRSKSKRDFFVALCAGMLSVVIYRLLGYSIVGNKELYAVMPYVSLYMAICYNHFIFYLIHKRTGVYTARFVQSVTIMLFFALYYGIANLVSWHLQNESVAHIGVGLFVKAFLFILLVEVFHSILFSNVKILRIRISGMAKKAIVLSVLAMSLLVEIIYWIN